MRTVVCDARAAKRTISHPLDGLTANEITRASEACKKHAAEQGLADPVFSSISLQVCVTGCRAGRGRLACGVFQRECTLVGAQGVRFKP